MACRVMSRFVNILSVFDSINFVFPLSSMLQTRKHKSLKKVMLILYCYPFAKAYDF